jgi:hypothetical protein
MPDRLDNSSLLSIATVPGSSACRPNIKRSVTERQILLREPASAVSKVVGRQKGTQLISTPDIPRLDNKRGLIPQEIDLLVDPAPTLLAQFEIKIP